MKNETTISRYEFEEMQNNARNIQEKVIGLLKDAEDNKIGIKTAVAIMHTLVDESAKNDVFQGNDFAQNLHELIDLQYAEYKADSKRNGYLFSSASSGNISNLFAPYDGSYYDFLTL